MKETFYFMFIDGGLLLSMFVLGALLRNSVYCIADDWRSGARKLAVLTVVIAVAIVIYSAQLIVNLIQGVLCLVATSCPDKIMFWEILQWL
ncbi:hypothetical protein VPEG_00052 [Vibrio phage SIO-2]|uniref:hypothetical protein n=1 Tax=Vibrio phage SIO-2 TaxID=700512 RepID=UPI0002357C5A|nr:hypothetical protein VPEG_00052 [Vibrio phage SIO-2]AET42203.1 hypothetical protein VPEG_00052 [Vibrio phage SIO-2]QKE60751.1 hypothetical protein vBVhaSVHB1_64 [Vibrio phage vB_VhaS-VHB1]